MGFGGEMAAGFWRLCVIVVGVPVYLLLSPYMLYRRRWPVQTIEQWIRWGEDAIARGTGLNEYPRYPSMAQLSQRKLDRMPRSPRRAGRQTRRP